MLKRGYSQDFADRLFDQIKGFGGYGFPESHSASFALLAYVSAWLKCHHPAAFYTGLLNSQPMGFYTPSQLIQDARRHKVMVLPVDINHSDSDHQMLAMPAHGQPPIRLGLRLIKGLSQTAIHRIVSARRQTPFRNIRDLRARAQLERHDMEALAAADALASLSGNRHQTQWQVMGLEPTSTLLNERYVAQQSQVNDGVILKPPTVADNVLADYQTTGLTLREHPLSLLRNTAPFNRCKRAADIAQLGNHRFVRIAGLVTCRQRPGTASGVVFLTLEDETGNHNVVVWTSVQERCRQALMTGQLLVVKGTVESRDGVTHIIAGHLDDQSHALADLGVRPRHFR